MGLLARLFGRKHQPYQEYLRSPDWRAKREQRLHMDRYRCRLCGSRYWLEVHHCPDSYHKIPYESVEEDLITLCHGCHGWIEQRIRGLRK